MSKKEEPSMEIRSFFKKCPTQGMRQKNRRTKFMSFCLNKCGADPRSPILDPRKNGIGAIFLGAKMLKMRKKLKKTIIFCE